MRIPLPKDVINIDVVRLFDVGSSSLASNWVELVQWEGVLHIIPISVVKHFARLFAAFPPFLLGKRAPLVKFAIVGHHLAE